MEQKGPPFVVGGVLKGVGEQTYVTLTMGTVVIGVLVIFITAFLLGLWCGWLWQQRRGTGL